LFLLYLVLPQTQGAKLIYQTYIHPWLEENESAIEEFIASAHDRLRSAGSAYLKRAIELLKTNVLGLPPSEEQPAPPTSAAAGPQSYTQALLARFSLPNARWTSPSGAPAAGATGATDFYNLLASAVSAVSGAGIGAAKSASPAAGGVPGSYAALVPDEIRGATARMSFIAAQRERLAVLMTALDREATRLQTQAVDEDEAGRPASGLSKSRSEADFEKLEAESGAEDNMDDSGVRKRTNAGTAASPSAAAGGSWMPWGWNAGAQSSGVETEKQ
jgi:hypothetical protein